MWELAVRWAGLFALMGGCGWALWKGGVPERVSAAALLTFSLLSPLVQGEAGVGPSIGVLAIDFLNLSILVGLNWRWRRLWLIAALGFQIVQVSVHLAMALGGGLDYRAYVTVLFLTFYGVLAATIASPFEARRLDRPAAP